MAGDVKFAVVNGTSPASTGTQNYTSSGFGTPKGIIVMMSGVSSGDNQAHAVIGVGASDLTSTWATGGYSLDANSVTSARVRSTATSARVIYIPTNGGATWAECDFSSTTTDGVTLNWVVTPGAGYYVTVILIGGADAAVKAGSFQTPASSTETTVTTGIDQDFIFFSTLPRNAGVEVNGTVSEHNWGFAKVETTRAQASTSWRQQNATANSDPWFGYSDEYFMNYYRSDDYKYNITANDTTSFKYQSVGALHFDGYIFYVAVDCGDKIIYNDAAATPTSTGDWSRTGFGMTPDFLFGFMVGEDDGTGVNTAQLHLTDLDGGACQSLFVSDGTTDAVHGIAMEDAAATTNENSVSSQSKVFLQYDDTLATKHTEATVSSFDSDGVTFNFTTAAAARYINFFAIGEAAAEPEPEAATLLTQERAVSRRVFGRTFGRVN